MFLTPVEESRLFWVNISSLFFDSILPKEFFFLSLNLALNVQVKVLNHITGCRKETKSHGKQVRLFEE